MKKCFLILASLLTLNLSSCVSDNSGDVDDSPTVTHGKPLNKLKYDKHVKGYFKIGKPYKQKGFVFKPKVDIDYSQVGLASWYGPNFHGKKTANGAIYNQNEFTAAHPTLPLPSVVKVTNLENNKVIHVVVNDRGPFHTKGKRIIDLSKKSAEHLGLLKKGVGKVKVEYMHEETKKLIALYPQKQKQVAINAFQNALTRQVAHNEKLVDVGEL